jgi:hypothetical protein
MGRDEKEEANEQEGQKKASAFVRTLPDRPDFKTIHENLCFCGPCRTPSSTIITQEHDPIFHAIVEIEI